MAWGRGGEGRGRGGQGGGVPTIVFFQFFFKRNNLIGPSPILLKRGALLTIEA
jgi:hypothetical protein